MEEYSRATAVEGEQGTSRTSPPTLGFFRAQLHFRLLILNYPFSISMSVVRSCPGPGPYQCARVCLILWETNDEFRQSLSLPTT